MKPRVLFVDDEHAMLDALRRMVTSPRVAAEAGLSAQFSVETAASAQEALALLNAEGTVAVVVSDLRMPGMGGVSLFEEARRLAPTTVRILLTGHVDAETALDAINRGSIFRYLTKPCAPVALCQAIGAGLEQHRLVLAERQLLEQTLAGTIRMLTDVIGFVNPTAAARTARVRRYVGAMIATLAVPQAWRFDLAAMLSHLGCLTMSNDLVDTAALGAPMTPDMRVQFQKHPQIGRDLLAHIPRLEEVADMIAAQQSPVNPADAGVPMAERHAARLGGQVLKVAMEFDRGLVLGSTRPEVLQKMLQQPKDFDAAIVASLAGVAPAQIAFHPRHAAIGDLEVGMVLQEDLRSGNGLLLMASDHEITWPMLLRLRNMLPAAERRQLIRVLAPQTDTADAAVPVIS